MEDVGIEDILLAEEDITTVMEEDIGVILTDLDTEDAIEAVTEEVSAVK